MDKQSRKWSRIDYIGQNGNNGEHYMKHIDLFTTYCPVECNTLDCEKHKSKAMEYAQEHPVYWMLDKPVDCEKYAPCTD